MKRCKVCRLNPAVVQERCDTCYRYWKRKGEDRPPRLSKRQSDLNQRNLVPNEDRALRRVGKVIEQPLGPDADENTSVYRMYDKDKNLLYVGITNSGRRRFHQHAADKPWWHEVYVMRVEHYSTRRQALLREAYLIATHDPKYNVMDPWKKLKQTLPQYPTNP